MGTSTMGVKLDEAEYSATIEEIYKEFMKLAVTKKRVEDKELKSLAKKILKDYK